MIWEKIQKIVQDHGVFGESFRLYERAYEISDFASTFFLAKSQSGLYLVVWSKESDAPFEKPHFVHYDAEGTYAVYPFNLVNYRVLTKFFPYLRPTTFDARPSFGCGDRLGMVSAAQITALQKFPIFPVLAQQSPRELERTHRTFQDVLLGAAWGILESGYQGPFGADADHIKDEVFLREARDCGFTMYTLDLSEKVDFSCLTSDLENLRARFPQTTPREREIFKKYVGKRIRLGKGVTLEFSEEKLLPLLYAYLPALDQVERFWCFLKDSLSNFDLEISLDEGPVVTTLEAHFFVAQELHERGVDFQSLAPRFPGVFEKGVDYKGSVEEFTLALRSHVAVQRSIGGYRLSLHSGSDKLSIYPILAEETGGLFHVKTSGTSWLQALAAVAEENPELFRKIYTVAFDSFEENARAYSLSFTRDNLPPDLGHLSDDLLSTVFENEKIRQALHIAYGKVLDAFGRELRDFLFFHEEKHYQKVQKNVERHLVLLFPR
ncbi:MAG: tagaturonate epimerase family protein [Atribacterota bacterium]